MSFCLSICFSIRIGDRPRATSGGGLLPSDENANVMGASMKEVFAPDVTLNPVVDRLDGLGSPDKSPGVGADAGI